MASDDESAPGVLLEATNPFGNLVAVVEDDGETTYLYLHHAERREWGMRALWIANHVAAGPLERGRAPRMPSEGTRGIVPHFSASNLELVWTVEGDGVLLLARGVLM